MRRFAVHCIALCILASGRAASASDCDASDPSWLTCEDFEDGALGWDAWYAQSSWVECDGCPDGTNDPERIRLEHDAALAHDGEFALHMPGTSAEFLGGTLRFATCAGEQEAGCALQGHDRLYFRTWVRLAADHDYVHHFIGLGGSRPDAYWDANGNAGCRPNGERWAGTRVDLDTNHELFFYTYFPDMNCDSGGYCSGEYAEGICEGCAGIDMPCEGELECCWGNHFVPDTPVVVPTEEWTCLEMMMQLNTPGQADGSMAFWVNDVLAHEVGAMAWRDVEELQLNRAMLEHYIDSGDTDHANAVWFDDVIVSTEAIGCNAGGATDGGADDTGSASESSASTGSVGDSGPQDGGVEGAASTDDETGGETSVAPTGTTGRADSGTAPADGDVVGCGCRANGGARGVAAAWLTTVVLMIARRRRFVAR